MCGRVRRSRRAMLGLVCASSAALWGCSPGAGSYPTPAGSFSTIPKAICGPGDHPESGLQGQVPAPLRKPGGFLGFSCNLTLVAKARGEGAGWQAAFSTDAAGHTCAYYDTSPSKLNRARSGVVVVDATDPAHPAVAGYLASEAMSDPLESLKVNERRQLLGAVDVANGGGGPEIELYDLSADCRFPRLLTRALAHRSSQAAQDAVRADEGSFSPDGLTYYATNLRSGAIYVIDIGDVAAPKLLAEWDLPFNQRTSGLSISADGNRAYLTLFGHGAAARVGEAGTPDNGIVIADVSAVQSRIPHPQIKVLSTLLWADGSGSHQTVPVRIHGKSYLIATDQSGSGLSNAGGWAAACSAHLPPFGIVRIIDISDERNPQLVSKLGLEVSDPDNCSRVTPDLVGLSGFTYDSHYCSADSQQNATTLACAFFESGIRVIDIRDPSRPREIGYFVPASVTTPSPGSQNTRTTVTGRPDHCSAQALFDARTASLLTTCQDSGFVALKFTNSAWPFTPRVATEPAAR
jgi:hypothetical protein